MRAWAQKADCLEDNPFSSICLIYLLNFQINCKMGVKQIYFRAMVSFNWNTSKALKILVNAQWKLFFYLSLKNTIVFLLVNCYLYKGWKNMHYLCGRSVPLVQNPFLLMPGSERGKGRHSCYPCPLEITGGLRQ